MVLNFEQNIEFLKRNLINFYDEGKKQKKINFIIEMKGGIEQVKKKL
jgi:hypothetical protein